MKVFKVKYCNSRSDSNNKEFMVYESEQYPDHYLMAAEGSHTGGGTLAKKYCTIIPEGEVVEINKFQLEVILDALRMAANLNGSWAKKTSYDRSVMQAYQFAENALKGEKDKHVSRL